VLDHCGTWRPTLAAKAKTPQRWGARIRVTWQLGRDPARNLCLQ
jgi:hypothetical protein